MESKNIRIKKSEVSHFASLVKEVLNVQVAKDTTIEADLMIFDSQGDKAVLTISLNVTGEDVTYLDVMQKFKRKFSPIIFSKAARMNLVLRFGDSMADSGLLSADDYVFTGKRDTRYRVFNGLFMLCAASHEGMKVPKHRAKSVQKRPS